MKLSVTAFVRLSQHITHRLPKLLRILIQSPSFSPNVGGVESVGKLLSLQMAERGHQVRVFTHTPARPDSPVLSEKIEVIRSHSSAGLWQQVRWCDAYLQMGLSLKGIPPLLFFKRRWVVSHHTWYTPARAPLNRLKRMITRFATNAFCSQAVGEELACRGTVVGNPYDAEVFHTDGTVSRVPGSLAFVGRLVSDKGGDVLLHALRMLHDRGLACSLTMVGGGPELHTLQQMTNALGLCSSVTFTGPLCPAATALVLNRSELLVVPSRWNEPFGVVALEGIACGCVIVGSNGGGLPEAIGPCGVTFPNGHAPALAGVIQDLLSHPDQLQNRAALAGKHLERFSPQKVADRYLQLLEPGS